MRATFSFTWPTSVRTILLRRARRRYRKRERKQTDNKYRLTHDPILL